MPDCTRKSGPQHDAGPGRCQAKTRLGRQLALKILISAVFLYPTVTESTPAFLNANLIAVHKRNLLDGRVAIASCNHHIRLLSPSLLVGSHHRMGRVARGRAEADGLEFGW
jgi:hypothetical protein